MTEFHANKNRWKFRELIRVLGGPEEVARIIKAQGCPPPPVASIRGWRQRNSVPGNFLPFLLIEAQQLGMFLDLRELRGDK